MRVLVTGSAGFIGSHFVRLALREMPSWEIVSLDALTYAGDPAKLEEALHHPRHRFFHGDITDSDILRRIFSEGVDRVIHFAAESHVDRSLSAPSRFTLTNLLGTQMLLEACARWKTPEFLQVSTDEVYGDLELDDPRLFQSGDPLRPSNPYSATKAGAELLVRAWGRSYGLSYQITRCGNNYGSHQAEEKLIPKMIRAALEGRVMTLYGDGQHIRDWIHVQDHCRALLAIVQRGERQRVYNISASEERSNRWIAERICEHTGRSSSLIRTAADRPGHDRRYAMSAEDLRRLGWRPAHSLSKGLRETVAWYAQRWSAPGLSTGSLGPM